MSKVWKTPEQRRALDARRRARPDLEQKRDESGHGSEKTYRYWFCRCDACRKAESLRHRRWRQRRSTLNEELAERWARGEDV